MANCAAQDSSLPEGSYNTTVKYKGKLIPAVRNDVTKRLTYTRNGYKVETSLSGAITYKTARVPKEPATSSDIKVGNYVRTVDSQGWTTGVRPAAGHTASDGAWGYTDKTTGKVTVLGGVADGVDRSKTNSGSEYYKSSK